MKIKFNSRLSAALGVLAAGAFCFLWVWSHTGEAPKAPVAAPAPVAQAPRPTRPNEVLDWSRFETEALGLEYNEIVKRWTCPSPNLGAEGSAYFFHRTGPDTYDRYTVEWKGAFLDGKDKQGSNLINLDHAVAANIIKESCTGKP